MSKLCLILGDQLSMSISCLKDFDQSKDVILMCEVWDEASYVKHHKKKIAFLFSAMRHFAAALRDQGYYVAYTQLDDPENTQSLEKEVARHVSKFQSTHVVITTPGEYRLLFKMNSWQHVLNTPVTVMPDDRFLCSKSEFKSWAGQKNQLRMEYFYRYMRQKHDILMDDNQPAGGQWNFDKNNRKPPKKGLLIPEPSNHNPDPITKEVIALVNEKFPHHFGDLEPFYFAVTRSQALEVLDKFIHERLPLFGDYQDAMIEGEPWMYHSHVSFYINCGLLSPQECLEAAEISYRSGQAPINAVEGFIRQIIGWREFVRGIYWLKMPAFATDNYFQSKRNLPDFYWTADTQMNCLKQCVNETKKNAYAHHIQRLMVLGNFALLAGLDPEQVNEWFLVVYADAYEWVELPNVSGMILFADGGFLASKPYAAGGSYINKMSNYCTGCRYKVSQKNGPDACPFNYLYWDFLARNRHQLENNRRMGMMYNIYNKMSDDKRLAIKKDSTLFLDNLKDQDAYWRQ